MGYTNADITKSLEVFKEVCTNHYEGGCLSCPMGYDVHQNGGSDCKLSHSRPNNFKIADSRWKALT